MSPEWLAGLPAWLEAPTLGRLALALALGTAMGLEREMRGKPAGLRTVMLITVGAALFTEASLFAAGLRSHDLVRADPARIAAQIVSGIGFIGAGTILVHRGNVVGLTTAATLWVAAAIGMSVGLGQYVVAVGATVFVLLTLTVIGWIEHRVLPDVATVTLHVGLEPENTLDWIEAAVADAGFHMTPLELARGPSGPAAAYRIRGGRRQLEGLLGRLFEDARVRELKVE